MHYKCPKSPDLFKDYLLQVNFTIKSGSYSNELTNRFYREVILFHGLFYLDVSGDTWTL